MDFIAFLVFLINETLLSFPHKSLSIFERCAYQVKQKITNNKAQTIRSLDKLRMAHLFNDMQKNPTKYPQNVEDWLTWLNQKSGDNILNL